MCLIFVLPCDIIVKSYEIRVFRYRVRRRPQILRKNMRFRIRRLRRKIQYNREVRLADKPAGQVRAYRQKG